MRKPRTKDSAKVRASGAITQAQVSESAPERRETVSNVENPSLGPGGGGAGLQNPSLGPGGGGAGPQNPPLGFVTGPERQQHKGHRIELRARTQQLELLINDQPIRYRQLPNGSYALDEYAYDRSQNLIDLAKRFIDYRDRAEEIRRKDLN
jgi:hypothetical protein